MVYMRGSTYNPFQLTDRLLITELLTEQRRHFIRRYYRQLHMDHDERMSHDERPTDCTYLYVRQRDPYIDITTHGPYYLLHIPYCTK